MRFCNNPFGTLKIRKFEKQIKSFGANNQKKTTAKKKQTSKDINRIAKIG
jgi:hypothetical protein